MAAYDKVCQKTPTATFCGLPLYWPGPPNTIAGKAGMHRVYWDMHFEPFEVEDLADAGDEEATGAVPHRTYDAVNAPWAPPGSYTVRLTVDGKTMTQPITVKLDPRVKTPAPALAQLAALSREMYDGAVAARAAFANARAIVGQLDKLTGDDIVAFRAKVDSLAPAPSRGGERAGAFRRRFGSGAQAPTLETVSSGMMGAAMALQGADVAPTASQVAACERARKQSAEVMATWNALKTKGLAELNAKRKAAGQPLVTLP